jgi:BirA family biotin operon repressor/biotin-[acetyl-CoA-carboxylase] ligase
LIQQLRRLGVDIAGHPATGYQLQKIPDLLLPEILAPMLRGSALGHRIQHYFKIPSTNSAALEAAAGGAPEGTVFLGEEQLSGRGRGLNSWHSPRSTGIYCSVVLRPPLAPADALLLSLAAGLSVVDAVERGSAKHSDQQALRPDLRWPNDVLLNGKKFCGILIELTAETTRVRHAVIGIGINVNQASFPDDLKHQATSLRLETGHPWSRVELVAALLRSLDQDYRDLKESPPNARGSIFRRFEQHSSSARGRKVHVDENGGFDGVTEGLDEHGFLRVRTPQGLRTVLSGGVR